MTKIATKKPDAQVRPVYVTDSEYEIWYSKPQSLGRIENRKGYWYTADGRRFASSRDAMGYLVHILDITGNTPTAVFSRMAIGTPERTDRQTDRQVTDRQRVIRETVIPPTSSKPEVAKKDRAGANADSPVSPPTSSTTNRNSQSTSNQSASSSSTNQNHPMFQQYLDFLDYQARRKSRSLDTGNN